MKELSLKFMKCMYQYSYKRNYEGGFDTRGEAQVLWALYVSTDSLLISHDSRSTVVFGNTLWLVYIASRTFNLQQCLKCKIYLTVKMKENSDKAIEYCLKLHFWLQALCISEKIKWIIISTSKLRFLLH